ncbi:MAG: type I polyketide synthase [Kibdelosporangium sp.]
MRYTLPALFAESSRVRGDAPAVFADGHYRSWERWHAESDALARGLQEMGVGKGDVVAVHLPNCWELLTSHVAIASAGAVMLPLHAKLGESDMRSLIERAGATIVVIPAYGERSGLALGRSLRAGSASLRHVLLSGDATNMSEMDTSATGAITFVSALLQRWKGASPLPVTVLPDDHFVYLPSSGTTSLQPKICVHTHDSLLSNAVQIAEDGQLLGTDEIISASPLTHLYGLLSVHISMVTGGRQALLPRWDVEAFFRLAREADPAVLFAVPAQAWDILSGMDAGRGAADLRLREIRLSGAVVPDPLADAIRRRTGARVVVHWGMSELGGGLYTRPGDAPDEGARGVGRPVSGAQVRVVAGNGEPCVPGEGGELQFRGRSMFTGYLGAPELTRAALTTDGWLRTGDQATLREDGTVVYLGRSTDLINVGGVKFSAAEIETLLADMPALRQVAVLGLPDERLGEYPCLVVSTRGGSAVTLAEVTSHLIGKGVAEYKLPVELIVLDDLPSTPTGKITKRRLAPLLGDAATPPAASWRRRMHGLGSTERFSEALRLVRTHVAEVLGGAGRVEPDEVFTDHGLRSLTAVRLARALARSTGLPVATTVVFDHPTPQQLALHLAGLAVDDAPAAGGPASSPANDPGDPIAVIGLGCRIPGGVTSADEFWGLLAEGRDVMGEFPADRDWSPDAAAGYPRVGGFVGDATCFDAAFFGISPREAAAMDPQQRVLLETAWAALEHATIIPRSLRDSDTGVFVGMMATDYESRAAGETGGLATTGNASSVASGRISYFLGLRGPALTVDTACSSSLVAVHLAAQSLRSGECSLAIASGVTIMCTPRTFAEFSRQQIISSDGRCRSFADSADGTGWSEAAGAVVLERLSDARRAGHPVLAVIRGSAVNQDGRSNGLTAPNGPAQRQVMLRALAAAGLVPSDVDMLEAHGSGTRLGDPIEAGAVIATYGGERDTPMLLGSVKSNVGHTQAAAGVVGMIKAILSLRHGMVPKTLHIDQPTSHVDWSAGTVRLATEFTPWPVTGRARRAAVSSFGISGTNAHVILEQAPAAAVPTDTALIDTALIDTAPINTALIDTALIDTAPINTAPIDTAPHRSAPAVVPVALSAATPQALRAAAARLLDHLDDNTDLTGLAYSLISTRTTFDHRAVVVASDRTTLAAELAAVAEGKQEISPTGHASARGRTVFVFPGHGSQWAGMGRELLDTAPVFATAMAECDKVLSDFVDWSLAGVLDDEEAIGRLDVVQPALFSVMYSLARLWESIGVVPDAVIGHSQGELAAACFAGALSLRDALRVVVRRGALCASLPTGLLLHVPSTEGLPERLTQWEGVTVAAHNGPSSVILTGSADAITELAEWYETNGVRAKVLLNSFPSHSPAVEAVREAMLTDLSDVAAHEVTVPWFSTVHGTWMRGQEAGADYWYANLRQPVGFGPAIASLVSEGFTHFVEVSPHPVLTAAVRKTVPDTATVTGTLRRDNGGISRFLTSAAEGFVRGLEVDWARWFDGGHARHVILPTYPFHRDRYWLSAPVRHDVTGIGQERLAHPLIRTFIEDPEGDTAVFTGRISLADLPWLADHRVHDVVVVPGVALLELLAFAGDRLGSGLVSEAIVESPLVVPEDGAVHLQVRVSGEHDGRRTCTVHSRVEGRGTWTRNVTSELDRVAAPLDFTLAPWPPRGARPVNPGVVHETLADAGVTFGPALRGLQAVWRRGPELFAEVTLPADLRAEASAFRLHPALLDGALHPVALLGDHSAGPQIPFAWRGVRLPATGATALRVRVRRGSTPDAFTIRVTDDDDMPVAQVDSVLHRPLRTFPTTTGSVAAESLFRIDWVAATGTASGPSGWSTLDLRGEQDLRAVLQRTLAAVRETPDSLLVVTGGAVAARPGEAPDPVQAAVWGLVRSAQEERPGSVVLVDGDDSFSATAVLPDGEPEVAVRGRVALVPRLTRENGTPAALSLPPEGTVLITGGTGTLGTLLAAHLVKRHGVRRLLLLSRRGLAADGAAELRDDLARYGAIADIVACDVSDRAALAAAIAGIPAAHPLTCVVHAAGVRRDGVIGTLGAEHFDAVLSPKADAAWHLHELTAERPVAAFVLFSSIAGLLGSQGQGNYGAANAYLDALAEHRRTRGLPAVSIAWGLWNTETGLTGSMTAVDRDRIRRRGIEALSDDEALLLFDAALGAGPAVLAAMKVNRAQIQQGARGPVWHGVFAPRHGRPAQQSIPPAADLLLGELTPLDEAGQVDVIENLVRAQAAVVLGHSDPAAVDVERDFVELGFDSLAELDLRERLARATGIRLPPEAVIGGRRTISGIARLLRESLAGRITSSRAV